MPEIYTFCFERIASKVQKIEYSKVAVVVRLSNTFLAISVFFFLFFFFVMAFMFCSSLYYLWIHFH